jgi:uncharacterized protein (TIGR01777 family)
MRIILTGGSGLIGRVLTQRLVKADHEVIILSRNPGRVKNLPSGARAVQWDARTAEGWREEADGADAIVNLAGENLAGEGLLPDRWTPAKKAAILQSRANAGQAVVDAVQQATNKPGVVIQASAIGYYGVHADEQLDESSPAGDDFLADVCQKWEAATAPVEEMGVRRATVRIGLVLSKEGGPLPSILLPYKFFAGGPLGSGRQWWSWIHIQDVAGAIQFLIEHPEASGPINLTAPNPLTNDAFGKTLAKVLGRPHLIPAPAFALRTLFGEAATVVVDGQRVLPAKLESYGYSFQFTQLESALKNLLT